VAKRLILLGLLIVGVAVVVLTGAYENFSVDAIRQLMSDAGPWGPVVFLLLFSLDGIGVHGIIFIMAANAVWPPWLAFLMCWLGAILAGTLGFVYARTVGRDFVAQRLPDRIRRFESAVVARSLRTVIVIRLLFFLAPWAHWALGLSPVGWRPFLLGSAIGYLPWVLVLTFAGGPVFAWVQRDSGAIWIVLGIALVGAFFAFRTAGRYADEHASPVD
jgi:uncharacterized membrane protein YdjX (TVP38/TMEM64 family)